MKIRIQHTLVILGIVGFITPGYSQTATTDFGGGGGSLSPMSNFARRPFKFNISVREGFDDNVNTTKTDRQESFFTEFGAGVKYEFGSPRLQLSLDLSGGLTLYNTDSVDNQARLNGLLGLNALYMVTERVSLSFNTATGYYSQPNVVVPGTNISQQGDYFASSNTLGLLIQWLPRFSTTTSYTFSPIFYVEKDLNDNLGRIEQTVSQSFNFLVRPTTTAVVEYRINPVTYYEADLNSLNQFALVGFNHIFNPRMTWNTRVGVQFNILQNPIDGQTYYFGPYGESAFAYSYGEISRLSFTLRYGTEASGLQNVTQRQSFRTGVGITHGITRKLVASGGVFYGVNYYEQGDIINSYFENILELNAGLEFELNRFLSINTGYRFTGVLSPDNPNGEYSRDIVFVGLTSKF